MEMDDVIYLIDYLRHDNVQQLDSLLYSSLDPVLTELRSLQTDVKHLNELLEQLKSDAVVIPDDFPF